MAANIRTSGKEIHGLVGIPGPLERPITPSERGGSAFTLRAAEMAAMKASSSPHAPPTSGSSELKGARILLVEDSWHVGNAIRRLLRALGADVAGPVATIADAERLIAERKPDVAIVDINLRDGERANPLLDRLQEEGVPVIVITGYTEVSLQPGKVEAILQKPVNVEQFLAILRPIVARLPDR